jgi:uncharacterized tellurite resistance protein B-like protein
MPVLITILAALGAAAFWYYRIRALGGVAQDVVDAAQRARGAVRRRRFRNNVESSPFASVEDPAAAAAAMLIALAGPDGRLSAAAEAAVKEELGRIVARERLVETFTFGSWLGGQARDPNDLSLRFAKLWTGMLVEEERAEFHEMASRVAAADGEPSDLQKVALLRLKDRLGLTRR